MKHQIATLIFMTLFLLLPHGAAAQKTKGAYLFEQLRNPVYNKTFGNLFKGQKNIEPWLKGYIANHNGVDNPGESRIVDGKIYELYAVCKPHDCPGNFIYVLFEPGGKNAWGLFTKDDGSWRFFGDPDETMQAALRNAIDK